MVDDMELEKLFGLPAHPLLVHLPVVLVPVAGLIAILFAFKPAWLDRFGWWLVGLTGVGMLGAIMAAGSGEGLESLQSGEAETAAREDHFELGELARTLSIVFFIVVLAVVAIRYYAKKKGADAGALKFVGSKAGAIVAAVVLVLSAAGATYTMAKAGHQGAKLAWCEETHNCPADGGGSEQGDGDSDGG